MNRFEIFAAIKKAGFSAYTIGQMFGVTKSAVCQAIHGKSRSARIEKRISEITGLPLHQLWPQWYVTASKAEQSTDLMEAIPARLIAERERLALSPNQLAILGCVTPEEELRYECGAITPSALFLARLARSTHFDALYVITGRRDLGRVGA